jgi:O-antigen/teichoic acid export membrane protein
MNDLKQMTIRSGFAKLCGQGAGFVLRMVSVVTMARLLDPKDFGLVAMVTAVTGVYGLFTSAGLSLVTIQKETITDEQISTLFWINILVGTTLALLGLLTAPVLVRFYDEPRLFWITVITAMGFIINAAGIQHIALLQRQLRFVALTAIEILAQLVGVIIAIIMGAAGFGYWALVAWAVVAPGVTTLGVWSITSWMPGLPRRGVGISSMLYFGGTVTLNGLVVYVAYNLEKVLLGRFWGAEALGLYGRAYGLINVPTENLNGAIGGVAFSALARLQNDPLRLRNYFLKGYSFVNSMTLPTTIFCALFADDIILLALGPKWTDAVPIFRLLAPTVLIFGIINPLGWLLLSIGLQGRSLRIALVIAPLIITAYVIGLPFGPSGVAFAYSAALTVWLLPHILWCLHGTTISPKDLFLAISRPLLSAVVAGVAAFGAHFYFGGWSPPMLRLTLAAVVMIIVYYFMLLVIMQQYALYSTLLSGFRRSNMEGEAADRSMCRDRNAILSN